MEAQLDQGLLLLILHTITLETVYRKEVVNRSFRENLAPLSSLKIGSHFNRGWGDENPRFKQEILIRIPFLI